MRRFRSYTYSFAIAIVAVFLLSASLFGQTTDLIRQQLMGQGSQSGETTGNIPSLQSDRSIIRVSDTMPDAVDLMVAPQSEILLDQTVDSDTYIVGPGDLFGVYLWGSIETNYQIRITPEGYLIIPTVGSIRIADLTITGAAEVIQNAIAQNYEGLDVSIFLIEPRRFRLRVSGMVYVPGMHESHALERVSDVLERAGLIFPGQENREDINVGQQINITTPPGAAVSVSAGPGETYTGESGAALVSVPRRQHAIGRTATGQLGRTGDGNRITDGQYPVFTLGEQRGSNTRTILIHRMDEVIEADMLRFLTFGELDANPYVTSGDLIEVLPYAGNISVYGEVHDQGIYEFKDGDCIVDLIGFAGGMTVTADSSRATLVRFSGDNESLIEETVDLVDALVMNPDDPRYRLGEGDRLYIRMKYEYHEYHDVSIGGEVKYPGQYAIVKDGTMLTDIVRMTGGFTGYENLGEARLIRQSDFAASDLEYERIRALATNERTAEERFYLRSYFRTFAGSVNVDFEKLFIGRDLTLDVELRDGDIIYIPRTRDLVNVMGAVMDPGYFPVENGENYKFYLEKAGGYNWNANKKDIYVYKASTNQQYNIRYSKVSIEGGDTILVNERARRTFWSFFREYSGYVTTVATIILVGIQVSN